MSRLTDFLKNSFYLLMFLLVVPQIIIVLSKQYTTLITPSTKVGIMSVTHTLTNSGEYVKNLKKFFKDQSIKAILLRIDCGGGAAGTSQAIYNELTYLKQQYPHKPVVVFVENICASGAYYIACPCDWIVASGSSIIGSIGVYIALPRLKEFINQYKVEYQVTKTGKYKAILNPLLSPAEGEQALLQKFCDDSYQQFIEDVAKSRPALALKDADMWANGTIFTGKQALELKLIDQIGSLSHVEQQIRERAHIPSSQEIQWVKAEQKNMLMKLLSPDDNGESNDDMSLSSLLQGMFNSWMNQQTIAHM
jgi:protease-4